VPEPEPYIRRVTAWRHLVLFDGECGLCDRSVQWILRHDPHGVMSFAPLQGEAAREFVSGDALDTIVLVERDADGRTRLYERSRAFFHIWAALGGVWGVLAWMRVLPAFLTDLPYRVIAKNRIRWFGRPDACRVPDPATRTRFLA
jgi:predicted DCC family thiol-disulfide oxidoreductase YuxK